MTLKDTFFSSPGLRLSLHESLIIEKESKMNKVCYMIGLKDSSGIKMKQLQKSLDIEAHEIVNRSEFHCTIRFMKTEMDVEPLLEYLKGQELPKITGTVKSFARLNDAFVAKVESPEMHAWFNKVNDWMVEHGYPESDYDEFLPHVSFSYETNEDWETPKFDKDKYGIELEFTYHFVTSKADTETGPDYKTIWKKDMDV